MPAVPPACCLAPQPLAAASPRALPGNRDKNVVKCPCCESQLTFDANERLVTVTEAAA